jgi:hypothetical protein
MGSIPGKRTPVENDQDGERATDLQRRNSCAAGRAAAAEHHVGLPQIASNLSSDMGRSIGKNVQRKAGVGWVP